MDPVKICIAVLVFVAVVLFSYVGWQVNRRHKEMQFITIAERKRFQTLTIAGVAILLSALIGLGTAVMG